MKGIVFTEFLEMVDSRFGEEICDRIIEKSDLTTNGSYTSVGTYCFQELVILVEALSSEIDSDVPTLIKVFGEHLFETFTRKYPRFFDNNRGLFAFLVQINDVIHPEVLKLYPDAELPHFEHHWQDENHFILIYQSKRPFAKLAEGLITGALQSFNENVTLSVEDLSEGQGTSARFIFTKHP